MINSLEQKSKNSKLKTNSGLVYVFTGDGKGPTAFRNFALTAYPAVLQIGNYDGYGNNSLEVVRCLKG